MISTLLPIAYVLVSLFVWRIFVKLRRRTGVEIKYRSDDELGEHYRITGNVVTKEQNTDPNALVALFALAGGGLLGWSLPLIWSASEPTMLDRAAQVLGLVFWALTTYLAAPWLVMGVAVGFTVYIVGAGILMIGAFIIFGSVDAARMPDLPEWADDLKWAADRKLNKWYREFNARKEGAPPDWRTYEGQWVQLSPVRSTVTGALGPKVVYTFSEHAYQVSFKGSNSVGRTCKDLKYLKADKDAYIGIRCGNSESIERMKLLDEDRLVFLEPKELNEEFRTYIKKPAQ